MCRNWNKQEMQKMECAEMEFARYSSEPNISAGPNKGRGISKTERVCSWEILKIFIKINKRACTFGTLG